MSRGNCYLGLGLFVEFNHGSILLMSGLRLPAHLRSCSHLTCSLCIVLLSTATQRRHACNESLGLRLRYGEHPSEMTVLPMDSFRNREKPENNMQPSVCRGFLQ